MKFNVINIHQRHIRAFYRITILPPHIKRREGEAKAALQEELAEHRAWVKVGGWGEGLKAYQADYKARQAAYNHQQKIRSEMNQASNSGDHSAAADLSVDLDTAESTFRSLQAQFKENWH